MENKPKNPYWQALSLAWEFGYLIVVPLVIFALAGRYADQRLQTTPWMFLLGMGVSIFLTTILLIKKFNTLLHDIERQGKKQS